MRIKDFKSNLKLVIDGDDNWAFSNEIDIEYHAINFSKITLHNVIHKSILNEGLHFDNHPYLSKLNTLALATLYSDNKPIFTGIINSQGRYSLRPNAVKDKSIEIVDIRLFINRITPPGLTFINIHPAQALDELIEAMDEPKIKKGNVNFTDTAPIIAYDTTSKSPYSILKEIIATQTRSFLYFSQDDQGNLTINFASENDFKQRSAIEINHSNWDQHKIIDIKLEENIDGYYNKIRLESDNITSTMPTQEIFAPSGNSKSIWLSDPFGKLPLFGDPIFKNYYYTTDNPFEHIPLIIVSKKEYTLGKNCHLYYEQGSKELVFSDKFEHWNMVFNISYYSIDKRAITVENTAEIERVNKLSTFKGELFKFERFNDISDLNDLVRQASNLLMLNSKPRKEIKLITASPFLELGDVLNLNFNDFIFDGRYIVQGFNAKIKGNNDSILITYHLRNSLNSDTLINLYDPQTFKINPLILDRDEFVVHKYADLTKGSTLWYYPNKTIDEESLGADNLSTEWTYERLRIKEMQIYEVFK
nr:hypothetical protein MBKG4397_8340 [Mycoplasmopsis bovis]